MLKNLRYFGLVAFFTMTSALGASAAEPMEGYFGNTMICKGATWECHEWFNPDGTYVVFSVKNVNGIEVASNFREGKWTINAEGLLCRTANTPAPGSTTPPAPNCGGPGHRTPATNLYKAGDKWEDVNRTNQTEYFSVVAGHR